jgi:Sugar kinases, ribokinase family
MAEVWVMGELLCEVMRPEAGTPLDQPGTFLGPYPSGAPGIFIDTVARLGHSAGIVGGVGRDDFGKCLLDRLRKDGVDVGLVEEVEDGTTGVAFITYFEDGSRKFLYHFPHTPATMAKAPDVNQARFADTRIIHIMGCSIMAKAEFGAEIVKFMKDLAAKGVKVSFDPNIRPELLRNPKSLARVAEVVELCSLLQPGEAELLNLTGQATIEKAVEHCFKNPRLECIAMKNGSRGARIFSRDRSFEQAIYDVVPLDATGAGDCFDAGFIVGLLEGLPLEECAKIASAAAALNTAAFGPMEGLISKQTVEKMINGER